MVGNLKLVEIDTLGTSKQNKSCKKSKNKGKRTEDTEDKKRESRVLLFCDWGLYVLDQWENV